MLLTELVAKVNAKSFGETEYTYDDIYPYFQEAIDSINSEISEHRHIGDAPYARADDPLFSRLAYTSLSDLHISNYIVTYIVVAMDNAQLAVTSRTQTYAAQLNNFKKQLKADLYRFMPLTADSNNYLDLQPNSRRPRQLPNVTAWYDEQIGGLLPVDSDLPTLGVICDNPYGTLVPYDMNEHLKLGLNTYKYVFIPRPYFLQWYDKCIILVKITGYDTQSASVSTVVGYTLDLGFFSNKNALYLAAYNVLTNRNNNISVDTTDASDTPKEAISKVTGTVGSYTQPNGSDYFSLSNVTSYEITLINDSLLAHMTNYTSGSTYYTETKELITISGNQVTTTIINQGISQIETDGMIISNNEIHAKQGNYWYSPDKNSYIYINNGSIKLHLPDNKEITLDALHNVFTSESNDFAGDTTFKGYFLAKDSQDNQRLRISDTLISLFSPDGLKYVRVNDDGIKLNASSILNANNQQLASEAYVNSGLSSKQNTLTFDTAPTQSSNNPVTSGGVYNAVQNALEIAEGKTKNYVLSDVDQDPYVNAYFNTNSSLIMMSSSDGNGKFKDYSGNDVNLSDLKVGDIISIVEPNVPDRWVMYASSGSVTFGTLEIKLDFDLTPTQNSSNPVTSGGIYSFVMDNPNITQSVINEAYDESYIQVEVSVVGNDITFTNDVISVENDDITITADSPFAVGNIIYL